MADPTAPRVLVVDDNPANLEILHEMAPDSSKNTLRSWLQAGRVTVGGQRADRANAQIVQGQEIQVGSKVTSSSINSSVCPILALSTIWLAGITQPVRSPATGPSGIC